MFKFSIRAITLISLFFCGSVNAVTLDLNDFFADPTVTVTPDGTSATMLEDPPFLLVLLSNDPGLGDPNIIIPAMGPVLSFEYSFSEGQGDIDEFAAFVLDGDTGLSVGAPFEFFTETSGAGTVSFDLAPLVGELLGFQFELNSLAGDAGFGSVVEISNLRLTDVPIPSAALLYLSGLIFLMWRKQNANLRAPGK